VRRYVILVFAAVLVLGVGVSGAQEGGPPEPGTVDVCHVTGIGSYHLLTVSARSVAAHLDHGDGFPEGPVPGMPDFDFDADCNLVPDCGPNGCLAPPGYMDCDGDGFCEADWLRDEENCGRCGRTCGMGESCVNGRCEVICPPGWTCPTVGDADGDGIADGDDNCPDTYNPDQSDSDGDGIGDACDPVSGIDTDDDGVPDDEDNCPFTPNPNQWDLDGDLVGDVCDNCPDTSNPDQADSNGNGIGDACESVDDRDGDGLTDTDEELRGTDPGDADTDNDGLDDGTEVLVFLNPLDADSDDDGLSDGEEDVDGNGFLGALETDPWIAYTDSDLLSDGLEAGVSVHIPGGFSDGVGSQVAYSGTEASWVPDSDPATTTDARDRDTDNDGLWDGADEDLDQDGSVDPWESDPLDADTDDDGLDDGTETFTYGTDPAVPDTDGDGLSDGLETSVTTLVPGGFSDVLTLLYIGTDPASPSWTPDADPATSTSPFFADSDGDGLLDGEEDANGNGRVDDGETDPMIYDP
jgi:hypothetical protein